MSHVRANSCGFENVNKKWPLCPTALCNITQITSIPKHLEYSRIGWMSLIIKAFSYMCCDALGKAVLYCGAESSGP